MFQTKRKIIQNHGIKGVTRDRRNKQTKHNQPECQKPEKKGIYGQYQQMCIVVKKIEEKIKGPLMFVPVHCSEPSKTSCNSVVSDTLYWFLEESMEIQAAKRTYI